MAMRSLRQLKANTGLSGTSRAWPSRPTPVRSTNSARLEAGCDAYLSKPYSIRELLDLDPALPSVARLAPPSRTRRSLNRHSSSPSARTHAETWVRRCCQIASRPCSWYTGAALSACISSAPAPTRSGPRRAAPGPTDMNINDHHQPDSQPAASSTPRRNWRWALSPFPGGCADLAGLRQFCAASHPAPAPTVTPIVEVAPPHATRWPATLDLATSVPTRVVATPTFTPTPVPGTRSSSASRRAWSAGQGLNVRKTAGATGDRAGRYAPGAIVSVLEGPVDVDGYRWWRVGNNELSGWVADGDGEELWLSPDLGSTQPVNRAVQVGRRRAGDCRRHRAAQGASRGRHQRRVQHQVADKAQLSVIEGPVEADGYRWWKVASESGNISGWAAEGSGDERWLTPLE